MERSAHTDYRLSNVRVTIRSRNSDDGRSMVNSVCSSGTTIVVVLLQYIVCTAFCMQLYALKRTSSIRFSLIFNRLAATTNTRKPVDGCRFDYTKVPKETVIKQILLERKTLMRIKTIIVRKFFKLQRLPKSVSPNQQC